MQETTNHWPRCAARQMETGSSLMGSHNESVISLDASIIEKPGIKFSSLPVTTYRSMDHTLWMRWSSLVCSTSLSLDSLAVKVPGPYVDQICWD